MRVQRLTVIVAAAVLAIGMASLGCGLIPTGPSASDAYAYEVTGTGTLGFAAITVASPTAGAQQVTKDLSTGAFESVLYTGWGQNATATPAVTATATANGSGLACVTVRIIKNGHEQSEDHECGSPTVTATVK